MKHHDRDSEERARSGPRAERLVFVQHARMARAEEIQHRHHHQRHQHPAVRDEAHHDRAGDRRERKVPRAIAERRVGQVAAIELAERQQVPRGGEHAEPRGEHDRMDVDAVAVGDVRRTAATPRSRNSSGSPRRPALHVGRHRHDVRQPHARRTAAAPGRRTRRSGRRSRCRTAPCASGTPRGS